jgi:hypothetical protein
LSARFAATGFATLAFATTGFSAAGFGVGVSTGVVAGAAFVDRVGLFGFGSAAVSD